MSETAEFTPTVGQPVLWAPGGTTHVYIGPAQEEGYSKIARAEGSELVQGTVHTAELAPGRNYGEHVIYLSEHGYGIDHYRTPASYELMIQSRHQGGVHPFGLYVVGSAGESRQVYQGPMVPGPHASLIAHATVISSRPMTPPVRVEIAHGIVLVLALPDQTLRFRVEEGPIGHNPALIPV